MRAECRMARGQNLTLVIADEKMLARVSFFYPSSRFFASLHPGALGRPFAAIDKQGFGRRETGSEDFGMMDLTLDHRLPQGLL